MPARALWTGIFLIIISALAVAVSQPSPTAFIPGVLGLVIAILGIVADKNPALQKNAINVALALALLGFLGSLRAIPDFITLLGGGSLERPVATMAQLATLVISLAFLLRGLAWFLQARRNNS